MKVLLIGMTNSGKSTLGKILAGIADADQGIINRRRGTEVAYLSQEPDLDRVVKSAGAPVNYVERDDVNEARVVVAAIAADSDRVRGNFPAGEYPRGGVAESVEVQVGEDLAGRSAADAEWRC